MLKFVVKCVFCNVINFVVGRVRKKNALAVVPNLISVESFMKFSTRHVYNKAVFTPGLPDHITCPNYWWRNILYIQTWFPFPQLCMLWSWYLADDMQFYVWAIVILILSRRYVWTTTTTYPNEFKLWIIYSGSFSSKKTPHFLRYFEIQINVKSIV